MGVISGMDCTDCVGGALWIPMTGGDETVGSGEGSDSFRRDSD
jgi:hypothetical protein